MVIQLYHEASSFATYLVIVIAFRQIDRIIITIHCHGLFIQQLSCRLQKRLLHIEVQIVYF